MKDITFSTSHFNRDVFRQLLNVVFAVGQIFITIIGYLIGTNASFNSSNTSTSPVVPADSAFVIWGLIYGGALAYAIYQALPDRREDELLRRIGFYTASAYMATTVWLVCAQLGLQWLTVACIVWILLSVLSAFIQFILYRNPLTSAERWLVVLPTSIYAGWATVATIANTAEALRFSGFHNIILSDQNWSILMLIVGGLIAAFTTLKSRGNAGYALTVVWALFWVMIANITRTPNIPVAVTAGAMAAVVLLTFLFDLTGGYLYRRLNRYSAHI